MADSYCWICRDSFYHEEDIDEEWCERCRARMKYLNDGGRELIIILIDRIDKLENRDME
jgi:hypothetical protein